MAKEKFERSKPHCNPQQRNDLFDQVAGGGGWIRTIVGVSQQIYSLPPLATRAPLRCERIELLPASRDLSRVIP